MIYVTCYVNMSSFLYDLNSWTSLDLDLILLNFWLSFTIDLASNCWLLTIDLTSWLFQSSLPFFFFGHKFRFGLFSHVRLKKYSNWHIWVLYIPNSPILLQIYIISCASLSFIKFGHFQDIIKANFEGSLQAFISNLRHHQTSTVNLREIVKSNNCNVYYY